jgi:ketosteroid isomerase-like protein
MRHLFLLALVTGLAAGPAAAQAIDRQAALDAMVAAEHAFAKTSAEKGFRDAFLDFLAADSILFRPDPVSGKDWMRSRPVSPALLSWYPILAEISLAGDLGYTTGPWEFRAKGKDDPEVAAYGYFVTLWRKQADGTWKALIDHGTENPQPPSPASVSISPAEPARIDASVLPKAGAEAERTVFLEAERAFAKAAEQGSTAAYLGVLAEHARLHREGHQPFASDDSVRAALAQAPAPMTWEPAGAVIARSGDLGSTYGVAKRRESGSESPWIDADNYLRIWKKQPEGSWKLVLEVLTPRPKPAEKPVEEKPADGS